MISGILINIPSKGKKTSLILGAVFTVLFFATHLTYELISEPNKLYHLGIWTTPLKEVALAGGAFVVAFSFPGNPLVKRTFLEKLMPYGNLLFLYTITSFGISHIIYGPALAGIVPQWIANPDFWIYFTGISLTSAGIAIILGFRIRIIALLLSLEIFAWVWLVHVPGTLSYPIADNRGNLLASTFDALAFSGTALLIAITMKKQQWVQDVEDWDAD